LRTDPVLRTFSFTSLLTGWIGHATRQSHDFEKLHALFRDVIWTLVPAIDLGYVISNGKSHLGDGLMKNRLKKATDTWLAKLPTNVWQQVINTKSILRVRTESLSSTTQCLVECNSNPRSGKPIISLHFVSGGSGRGGECIRWSSLRNIVSQAFSLRNPWGIHNWRWYKPRKILRAIDVYWKQAFLLGTNKTELSVSSLVIALK
jgi:hypothetical protein